MNRMIIISVLLAAITLTAVSCGRNNDGSPAVSSAESIIISSTVSDAAPESDENSDEGSDTASVSTAPGTSDEPVAPSEIGSFPDNPSTADTEKSTEALDPDDIAKGDNDVDFNELIGGGSSAKPSVSSDKPEGTVPHDEITEKTEAPSPKPDETDAPETAITRDDHNDDEDWSDFF